MENSVQKLSRADQIIRAKLSGQSEQAIAVAMNVDRSYVRKILKEYTEEAQALLIRHAEDLLAIDVARLELLMERLMGASLDGDYAAMDRLFKAIKLKSDIILKTRPNTVTIKGDAENPVEHVHEHVFTVNSPEYLAAVTALQNRDKVAVAVHKDTEETLQKFRELPVDLKDEVIEGSIEDIINDIESDIQ